MNNSRILLGGLAAGVVILLGEFLTWGLLLEDAYQAMLATTGLTEASWAMIGYVSTSLVLGVLLAWLYAAIRPRSGPGPWTAVRAGAALWVAAWALPSIGNAALGLTHGLDRPADQPDDRARRGLPGRQRRGVDLSRSGAACRRPVSVV